MAQEIVLQNIQDEFPFPTNTSPLILTDNYNPMDILDNQVKETMRQTILENTHWDLLL